MKTLFSLLTAIMLAMTASAEERRVYLDTLHTTADTVVIIRQPAPNLIPIAAEARIGFGHTGIRTGRQECCAGIIWGMSGPDEFYSAIIRPGAATLDDTVDDRYIHLEVMRRSRAEGDSIIVSEECREGICPAPGHNLLVVELDPDKATATISIGKTDPRQIVTVSCQEATAGDIAIMATAGVDIPLAVGAYLRDMPAILQTGIDENTVRNLARNPGSPVGVWEYLDRDTDSRRAIIGGRYRLGIIEASDGRKGEYDIVYLGGAEVNPSKWRPGMLKGRLRALPFANHWDLQWYDSEMKLISTDLNASMEQNAILSLNFPLMKSTIRFYRAD